LQIHVEIITDNKPNYSHQGLIIVIYTTSHQFFFTHMYFGRKQKGCERSEKMIGVVKKRGIVVLYFFVYALNSKCHFKLINN
jgi:hypothetical protein